MLVLDIYDYFKLAYWGIIGVQYWITGTEHPVRNGITGFTAVENTHIADGSRLTDFYVENWSYSPESHYFQITRTCFALLEFDPHKAYGGITEKSQANRMLVYPMIGSRTIREESLCCI